MDPIEQDLLNDDLHPIDIVETLAEHKEWDFDRVGDNQIALSVEGAWRSYALSLAWCGGDEVLRLICTFEMDPPAGSEPELLRLLDMANDRIWTGAFTLWRERKMMVYRYGLTLHGGVSPTSRQVDYMMQAAILACERFYPAFQLVCWGNRPAEEALGIAIAEAYGRA
ncbi:MAG: YbjN domain-containing protein [Pseudomonadota bacterium]